MSLCLYGLLVSGANSICFDPTGQNTAQSHHSWVYFLLNIYNRQPIAQPSGQDIRPNLNINNVFFVTGISIVKIRLS